MNKINKLNSVKDLGFIKTGVEYFEGKKKYFSTSSVKEKLIREEGLFTFDEKPSRANRIVKKDDILQARMQNTNKALLINDDLHENLFSTGFFQLRPPKDKVLSKFIYYWLFSQEFNTQKDRLCSGSTQKAINDENLSKINLLVPSIMLQQKIVAKLDKIFAEIDKATAAAEINIKNAESLFKRYLNEIFESGGKNWKVEKLKDVTNKITDGSHNPPKALDFSSYLMFSSKNINNDNITFKSPRYLSKEDYELENKRTNVSIGDVLLTIVGTIGRCAVVEDPNLKITLQRSVAVIKPKEYLNSRFLMHFFISINELLNGCAHGAAQQGIYLKQLGNLEISFPEIKEQLSIVFKLDKSASQVKSLILNYSKKIEELKFLKQSILSLAFNGELVKAA